LLYKDKKLGKYQIICYLGTGGFGSVYLANDVLLKRKVALKIPHYQDKANQQEMLSEPRIMAALRHPNIVELITVEKGEDIFFMVMEYVDGESLDKLIRRNQMLPPVKAVDIAIDVCMAMDFYHVNQVVHQDLRPSNILITKSGVAKITDFGTSQILKLQNDKLGNNKVDPKLCITTEHFRDREIFQSDIWSLGVVLYEMLTGIMPLCKNNTINITKLIQNNQIIPPHIRQATVPKNISDIVMKILTTNIGDRYTSAKELLKDLRTIRGHMSHGGKIAMIDTALAKSNYSKNNNTIIKERLCRFCYRPMPRLAVHCPICGEINQ